MLGTTSTNSFTPLIKWPDDLSELRSHPTNGKAQHLVLAIPKEKLKNAPGFDKGHWPVSSDPEWSRIDKFYAVLITIN